MFRVHSLRVLCPVVVVVLSSLAESRLKDGYVCVVNCYCSFICFLCENLLFVCCYEIVVLHIALHTSVQEAVRVVARVAMKLQYAVVVFSMYSVARTVENLNQMSVLLFKVLVGFAGSNSRTFIQYSSIIIQKSSTVRRTEHRKRSSVDLSFPSTQRSYLN